jgi:hypothetical protein
MLLAPLLLVVHWVVYGEALRRMRRPSKRVKVLVRLLVPLFVVALLVQLVGQLLVLGWDTELLGWLAEQVYLVEQVVQQKVPQNP